MSTDNFSVISWAVAFLRTCPTQNSDMVYLTTALEEGRIQDYLNYAPSCKVGHPDFPYVYMAKSLLSKAQFSKEYFDPKIARAKAVERFFLAEEQCRLTNRRLRRLRWDRCSQITHRWELNVLNRAADIVASVLGSPDYLKLLEQARFTSGSDSANPFGFTSEYHKYMCRPEVTRDALDLGLIFINSNPRWAANVAGSNSRWKEGQPSYRPVSVVPSAVKIVVGNKVSYVPKNAKTDRAIAVEPHLNVLIQRTVGISIKQRLKRFGIDLELGQATNQDLAQLGSARGCLATVDLSMASDTVSRELVEWLVPTTWYRLMDSIRSKVGLMGSQKILWEKFSSMGNGFTFELESLIFYSIIRAVIPDDRWDAQKSWIHVYGDDLIIPAEFSAEIIRALQFCGFETNIEKTFIDGPFRESCGKDYINGTNIRPFFIKETRRFNQRSLFKLANTIRLYSGLDFHSPSHLTWLHSHWGGIVSRISRVLPIPVSYGPEQGLYVTEREFYEYGGMKTPCGSSWVTRFLTPIPDERKLRALYESRGRGSPKRESCHGLLLVALNDISEPPSIWDSESVASDITLNFSKGNPVRYVESTSSVGVFTSPSEWY